MLAAFEYLEWKPGTVLEMSPDDQAGYSADLITQIVSDAIDKAAPDAVGEERERLLAIATNIFDEIKGAA